MAQFESQESWENFILQNNLTAQHIQILQNISKTYYASSGVEVFLTVLYCTISIIAVIGNLLVMFVVICRRNMQTITNIFIANLAFSDVILGLFAIPFQFQSAVLQRWTIADFMCKVAPFVKNLSVSVSVLSLTIIAIDRYIAVMYPLKAGFHKTVAVCALVVIWIISIGTSIPEAMFYHIATVFSVKILAEKKICTPSWPHGQFYLYYCLLTFLAQYVIPLTIITFSYIRIAVRIWGNNPPGIESCLRRNSARSRNKKKVVKMLIIVVSLFAICWLPLQTYNIMVPFLDSKMTSFPYIHIVWLCSNWLAMSNACYNPFIYGLLNEKFKREFKCILGMCSLFCHKRRLSYNAFNKSNNESRNTEMSTPWLSFRSNNSKSGIQSRRQQQCLINGGQNQQLNGITNV